MRRQGHGGEFPGPPRLDFRLADMNEAVQEGPRGDKHRPGFGYHTQGVHHPGHPVALQPQALHHGFPDGEIAGLLQMGLHGQAIGLLIALHPGAPHRRPLGKIQGAKLHPCQVGQIPHDAPQGVDFLDQVPFGQAAHRRVARHGRHGVQVEVQKEDFQPHADRSQGAFAAGVSGAHHDQVKFSGIKGHGRECWNVFVQLSQIGGNPPGGGKIRFMCFTVKTEGGPR